MKKKLVLAVVHAIAFALFFCGSARADDIADARSVATQILVKLEHKKFREVWQSDVSDWFKEKMTEEAFLANTTMIQAQLGGPSSARNLVQQNKLDGDPQSGYKGTVYSFMFASTFPAVNAYEVIVLIREGGAYKISGLNFVRNPN